MQHTHLTRDDVDLFLDDEGSEVSRRLFLHLLAVCPECYKAGGAILEAYLVGDLKLDFDGLDAMFALTRAEALASVDKLMAKASRAPAMAGAWDALAKAQALFDGGSRDEATLKKILGLLAQGLYALSFNLGGGS